MVSYPPVVSLWRTGQKTVRRPLDRSAATRLLQDASGSAADRNRSLSLGETRLCSSVVRDEAVASCNGRASVQTPSP